MLQIPPERHWPTNLKTIWSRRNPSRSHGPMADGISAMVIPICDTTIIRSAFRSMPKVPKGAIVLGTPSQVPPTLSAPAAGLFTVQRGFTASPLHHRRTGKFWGP
ncbi:hypothetical protein BKA81DRAFT_355011 [Phyllosticta paracitricarpa]